MAMNNRSNLVLVYVLLGVALGATFAVGGILFDNYTVRPEPLPLGELLQASPLHYLIFLSPVVLGVLFFFLGQGHAETIALSEGKHATERNFKLLVDSVTDYAMYMLDAEGNIVSWNSGAERLKGYTAEELLGKNYALFYGTEDRERGVPSKNLETSLREGKLEAEGWRYRKDGTKFWAHVVIDPVFDAAGKHIGFAKVTQDCTEQKESAERIEHLAWHDWLTGLPNRGKFLRGLEAELEDAGISGKRVAVVNIDLDRFGEINDARGHAFGDSVLRAVSSCLRDGIGAGEFVARFGGDEFVASKTYTEYRDLADFTDRLRDCLARKTVIDGFQVTLGGSLGVASFPGDGHTPHQLVANANMAMHRAKKSLDESVCYYEPSMDEAARARRTMARELRSALDGDQFYLLYQEQRCAKTEKVVGYEALLRWDHPERGAVPPGHFMPIAEESGAILPIGAWALRKACQQAVASNVEEKIAVNVSPMQLADAELANTVLEALVGTGLSPQRLEIEVTESAIIKDKRRALKTLRELRSKGVSIAVDDFGTGYSSLDTLRSFPFDRLKIDQSFVAGLEKDAQLRAILGAILELGKSLHMETIAEGVETREQAKILIEAGCDALQGYLYGEPASFDSLRRGHAAGQA
jgi:diguanylate cyclase (GGDEF)-like protein/PAS domain S-box-containing protein